MVGSSSLSGITYLRLRLSGLVGVVTAKFSGVPSSPMRSSPQRPNYFGVKLVYMPNMRWPGASGLSLRLQKAMKTVGPAWIRTGKGRKVKSAAITSICLGARAVCAGAVTPTLIDRMTKATDEIETGRLIDGSFEKRTDGTRQDGKFSLTEQVGTTAPPARCESRRYGRKTRPFACL